MELKNKHKVLYYYATGSFVLLVLLKFFSTKFFESIVDACLTFLPFIVVLFTVALGTVRYKKHPENLEGIKRKALQETLYLLLITLLFYILYSPGSFLPIITAIKKMGQLFSMENYFLVMSYVSISIVSFALIYVFTKLYQKSKGTFTGSVGMVARRALYAVFFLMFFIFATSMLAYPRAYAPVTSFVSNTIYRVFYNENKLVEADPRVDSKVKSLREIISDTFNNLKTNVSSTNETLVTTIAETKDTLDNAISRTNDDLKEKLSDDIEERLDISGGTLAGSLTVEDNLTLEDTATTQDILPTTDDTYDLGSISKGWDNAYIHALHGSSILTIGDGSTSHSMTDSDDLLVSGDLEVNGTTYLDGASELNGAISLNGTTRLNGAVTFAGTINAGGAVISNLANPENPQDAVTRAYYEANTPAGVLSRNSGTGVLYPTTSGDTLDMLNAVMSNIGNVGTDFTSSGGLTLAGVVTASSASAHTLGSLGITAGAVTGMTSLSMTSGTLSGVSTGTIGTANVTTLDLGTNTIADGDFIGAWSFNSGAVTGVSAITADEIQIGGNDNTIAATDNGGVYIFDNAGNGITIEDGGDINANNNVIKNIGNGGTDFSSSGGLTLAGNLDANGTTNDIAGTLNLSGGALTSTGALTVTPASGSNLAVTTAGAGNFVVNTSEFVVDTGVGVGIGTATPSALLDLQKVGTAKANLDILELTNSGNAVDMNATSTAILFNQFYYDASTPAVVDAGRILVGTETDWTSTASTQDSYMAFSTASDGNIVEGMRINSSGQVLVNALQSGAQAFPDDAGVTQWVDLGVTTATATVGTVQSYSAMLDGAAVLTIYGTAGAATGTITDDTIGVGIGTSTPGAMLHVYDDKATDYVGEFYNDGNNANRYGLLVQAGADDASGTTYYMYANDGDGSNVGYIANISGTFALTDPSDIRTKTNIKNTELGGLDVISGLRVVDFNRLQNPDGPSITGFIAQEVNGIYPAAVNEGPDGMLGLAKEAFIPVLVKAVQEQQGQIESQDNILSGVALKTDTNISTLAGLQTSVDEQLGVISDQLADNSDEIAGNGVKINELAAQIASIEVNTDAGVIAGIQEQMETIQEEYQALMGSVIALNLENLIYKDSLGNVDLLEGKLIAKEVATGGLVITISDENAPTIGAAEIAAITEDILDEDGAETPDDNADGVPDGDGIDDETGANGLSVTVVTDAVTSDAKVFVTPKDATDKSLAVTEITDGSFTVSVKDPAVTENLRFDWWIVGVNDLSEDE